MPDPDDDQVVIKVHSTGVCGSDVHAFQYHNGFEWVALPRIMGHEYSGEITAIGGDVSQFSVGDRVVEDPTRRCGVCFQCRNGQENVCQDFSIKGMHRDGSYAEFTCAAATNLHLVPDDVPLQHAAIAEPLSVAARAVLTRSALTAGDTALVEGPGPIGLLTAAIADSMGASVLLSGLEPDADYRLPLANDLGIETIDLGRRELDSAASAFTDDIGFDVVFDATGHRSGVEIAAEQVRKGGQILIVGIPGEPSGIKMAPVVRGEIDIDTSYGSLWQNFRQALSLIEESVIEPEQIIDTSFSIDDPETAFTTFLEAQTTKPVFTFPE
nr:alcohol dehydrogenase catalytic domain-containing protein [Halococcus agarilyticus]